MKGYAGKADCFTQTRMLEGPSGFEILKHVTPCVCGGLKPVFGDFLKPVFPCVCGRLKRVSGVLASCQLATEGASS